MADVKARLADAVEELARPFAARGIIVRTWRHEVDARPALRRQGQSVQNLVDEQTPRDLVGDLDYQIYVGLMCKRFGTPTERAGSGTVHEFLEAKSSYDRRGTPKVLFYICRAATDESARSGSQLAAVQTFRAEYPGLFSTFDGPDDVLKQFRNHIIGELLDTLSPREQGYFEAHVSGRSWVLGIESALNDQARQGFTFLDVSPETPRRILRRIEELAGVEQRLNAFEKEVLTAAAYLTTLQDGSVLELAKRFLEPINLAEATKMVLAQIERDGDEFGNMAGLPLGCRCDLIAALIPLGRRLDLDRKAIRVGDGAWPSEGSDLDQWLACLTTEVECARGIVTYHLQVPDERWSDPLKGATSLAFEALWQRMRNVLTRGGISIAVARSRVELNRDLKGLPETVLLRLKDAAVPVSSLLPHIEHFGQSDWPELTDLLPLPVSRIQGQVVFRFDQNLDRRVAVNGHVTNSRGAGEAGDLEVNTDAFHPGVSYCCVLEADEGAGFEPRVEARVSRISAMEQALVDRVIMSGQRDEIIAVLSVFELSNDLLAMLWGTVRNGSATPEETIAAHRILRQAFEAASGSDNLLLFDRRDKYLDAMDRLKEMLGASREEIAR